MKEDHPMGHILHLEEREGGREGERGEGEREGGRERERKREGERESKMMLIHERS